MIPKIKICGVKTPETAKFAVGQGAEFIGLIFFPKSPRHISYKQAAKIHDSIKGNASLVAVMVNPSDEEISELVNFFTPDFLQLHGKESTERVKEIKDKFKIPLIKAISISKKSDLKKAGEYKELVKYILLDAKPPQNSELPGGNAVSFDWKILEDMQMDKKFFLSGGLNSNNINTALKNPKIKYLDLSSGVESVPGIKSRTMIKSLFEKVKKS